MRRNILRAGFAAVLLSLDVAAPVTAGPFEDGIAAYRRGDYPAAMGLLRPLADQGNASAQSYLGFMHLYGRGVPQDDAAAASWVQKAADQGNALAQHTLGFMYQNGRGVPQDDAAAIGWYSKAAD